VVFNFNISCFFFSTCTTSFFLTKFCTSCILQYCPICIIVTCCINICVYITIATITTSVYCVTLLCTSWFSYNRLVVVTYCRDFLVCRIIAARACYILNPTDLSTTCRFGTVFNFIVAKCIYICIYLTIIAVATSVRCVALFSTGWFCYN